MSIGYVVRVAEMVMICWTREEATQAATELIGCLHVYCAARIVRIDANRILDVLMDEKLVL